MINLEEVFNYYIDKNIEVDDAKAELLENFRKVEQSFKYYEDALSLLEKEKESSKINNYKFISEEIINKLMNFEPKNINSNIAPIEMNINHIRNYKDDLAAISKKFKHTETMWGSFLERNRSLDLSSLFIKNIIDEIKDKKVKFNNIHLSEITRLDQEIVDLNDSIKRSISMIETLKKTIKENDFIGKEPQELKKEIEEFMEIKYKSMTLLEINARFKEIENLIKLYEREKSLKTIKAKVIKIMNKEDNSIYNFGIELNGVILYTSEKISKKEILEDTKEYIYIDNFPIYGIIPVETLKNKLEVSDNQFYANKELNDKSFTLFILGIIGSFIVLSMTIFGDTSPLISIPLIFIIQGIFAILFKGMRHSINSKYKVNNMFYFFKVSYIFVSIGDDGLNVKKIIPKIFENFSKVVSHNVSISKNKEERE